MVIYPPGRLLRVARKDKSCFLLRGKWHEVPIGDFYVILSVSEISHDFSEKYMHRQFIGGILHFVQNDIKKCVIARHEVPRQSLGVKYAAYTPTIIPTDCRSRYAPSQ